MECAGMSMARALAEIDRLLGAATRVGGALATAAAVHAGAATAAHGQPVFFVDDDAPAGGDGRSWGAAYRDVQQALDEIRATRPGLPVVVKIAGGVYRPDRGTRDRGASFTPTSGVVMIGGFAGVGASDPELNDPSRFETVLSGDLNGDDGEGFVGRDDNSSAVVRVEEASHATFRGLTIRGGVSGGVDARFFRAGKTIGFDRCRVVENDGSIFSAVMVNGIVVLLDSRVEGNRTLHGGGTVMANEVIALRSIVAGNHGPAFGLASGTSVWLEQCVVAGSGWAAVARGADGQITVRNSTLVAGEAGAAGVPGRVFDGDLRVRLEGSVVTGVHARPSLAPGNLRSLSVSRSCLNVDVNGLTSAAVHLELGAGTLLRDPMLVSPGGADGLIETTLDNDYRLRAGSPAIDFGDVASLSADSGDLDGDGDRDEPTPRDVMGMPRLVDDPGTMNQGVGVGGVLDLGALEFLGVSCRVDLDGSGVVGVGDWLVFVTRWLAREMSADFDRSGVLDEGDVFEYLAAYFAGCG
jgi:hypothetical protein